LQTLLASHHSNHALLKDKDYKEIQHAEDHLYLLELHGFRGEGKETTQKKELRKAKLSQ